jgi:hypothetical protein
MREMITRHIERTFNFNGRNTSQHFSTHVCRLKLAVISGRHCRDLWSELLAVMGRTSAVNGDDDDHDDHDDDNDDDDDDDGDDEGRRFNSTFYCSVRVDECSKRTTF